MFLGATSEHQRENLDTAAATPCLNNSFGDQNIVVEEGLLSKLEALKKQSGPVDLLTSFWHETRGKRDSENQLQDYPVLKTETGIILVPQYLVTFIIMI